MSRKFLTNNFKEVSKEEYNKFIENYKATYDAKIVVDKCGICEPPMISYYDTYLYSEDNSILDKEIAYYTDAFYNKPCRYYVNYGEIVDVNIEEDNTMSKEFTKD